MPGPVGSEYPGNWVMALAACFCGYNTIRLALSAYRLRHEGAWRWKPALAVAIAFFGFFVFSAYAIWINL